MKFLLGVLLAIAAIVGAHWLRRQLRDGKTCKEKPFVWGGETTADEHEETL